MDILKENLVEKVAEMTNVVTQAKKEYYSSHFYEFNRDILAPDSDLYEPLHRRVCDFVMENIDKKKILLLLPRGSFKSSVITVGYSLYRIVQDPSDRILIGNATYPVACQFLSQIKNHLQRNDNLKDTFGDMSANADQWREDRIFLSREKSYEQKEATISAQGVAANTVGTHVNVAILDDLVNDNNIGTKEQIEKVKEYYRGVLDLVDPDENGHRKVIIIGTTWHWDDLYAWIQETPEIAQDFAILKLPAYEGEWGTGKLLFPTRLGWSALEQQKRAQGSAHFSAQYMLNPVPEDTQVFRPPFKSYEETDVRGLELKKFITIDPAISEEKSADYSAMVCVGVDKNNDWYILDIYRDRVQPKRLIDQIFYWNEKWKPVSVGIETVAFQKALQYFLYDEMKRRNKVIPLVELKNNDRSKDERIMGLQPRYEMGSIFHPQVTTIPLVNDLEDELRRFPKNAHDDLVDALASQLELAFPPKNREERKNVNRNSYPA
jgi:predicted phage terminase large subunit-like protein